MCKWQPESGQLPVAVSLLREGAVQAFPGSMVLLRRLSWLRMVGDDADVSTGGGDVEVDRQVLRNGLPAAAMHCIGVQVA